MSIMVNERYEGPPAIANGGYVCGLLAESLRGRWRFVSTRRCPWVDRWFSVPRIML